MDSVDWRKFGKTIKIDGSDLFVIDTDPLATKSETIVIINGYPLNTYDYHQIIELLSENYRVVTHDHFGFGFSDQPKDYRFSMVDQANVCIKLWNKLRLKKVKIIASQYGAMVAKEILYKKNFNLIPFEIESVVFSQNENKQMFSDINTINYLHTHKNISKYLEVLSNHKNKEYFNDFEEGPKNIKYKEDQNVRAIWDNFNTLEMQKEVLVLSSYNEEVFTYWHRWINALKNTDVPVYFFWRKDDIANAHNVLLHMATFQKDNIKTIENKKCYDIQEQPKSWLLMVLEHIDKTNYDHMKRELFVG